MCPRGRPGGDHGAGPTSGICRSPVAGAPLCFGSGASHVARRESGAGPSCRGDGRRLDRRRSSRDLGLCPRGRPRGRHGARPTSGISRTRRLGVPWGFGRGASQPARPVAVGLGLPISGGMGGAQSTMRCRSQVRPFIAGFRRGTMPRLGSGTTRRPSSGNPAWLRDHVCLALSDHVLSSLTPARQRGCAASPHAWATVTSGTGGQGGPSARRRANCLLSDGAWHRAHDITTRRTTARLGCPTSDPFRPPPPAVSGSRRPPPTPRRTWLRPPFLVAPALHPLLGTQPSPVTNWGRTGMPTT